MSEQNNQHGQDHQNLSGSEAREKVASLVKGIHICMMNTVGKDGSIDSRPMALQNTPFDGTLWFLTRGSSEKVNEVQQDHHVTLTFAAPSDHKYVTLKGKAAVSNDRAKIKDLWNEMYKAWFPNGPEDPAIQVLRVDVADGDYWDSSSSKLVFFAKYALAAATGGKMGSGTPTAEAAQLIPEDLASGSKAGYNFVVSNCAKNTVNNVDQYNSYQVTATPVSQGKSGNRTFCSDESGQIRFDPKGGANCTEILQ